MYFYLKWLLFLALVELAVNSVAQHCTVHLKLLDKEQVDQLST